MTGNSLSTSSLLHKTILLCLVLIPLAAPSLSAADDWKYEETRHDTRDFVSGGSIHVRMTVGDLRISAAIPTRSGLSTPSSPDVSRT
jgi:hypothetical protein